MVIVVDAGNTNVDITLYKDKDIIYHDAILTIREDAKKYYYDFFYKIYEQYPEIEGYIVSSVVPAITDLLHEILYDLYHMEGLNINAQLVSDLVIHLKDRNELGADLIASTYGALDKYPLPIIVADLGTATKITVINEKAEFLGGMIVPGITISNKAIQLMIPHLPHIEPELPDVMLTDDTVQSMQAGLMYGTLYQVQGLVKGLEKELNIKATKVLTGGYGRHIAHKLPDFIYDESLLTDGILAIYNKYKK